MIAAFFGIAAIVCAVGWFLNHASVLALAKWIVDNGYTPPTDEEMKACTTYVIRKLLRVK